MRAYFFIFLCAFLSVALFTPMVRRLAVKAGAIQQIRKRDVHTVPTPRMGGVAMFLGFALCLCFARGVPWLRSLFQGNGYQQWVILLGAFLICLLGVADDLFDLDWMLKLGGQMFAAIFVAWKGVQLVSLPWGSVLISLSSFSSMAITVLLILISINAVNFIDGLDGLAAGIVGIGALAFCVYSYVLSKSQPSFSSMSTLLNVILAGICAGFLIHNWHPASIFMGDSGSMMLGYLLTCASLVLTGRFVPSIRHSGAYLPVFMPILLPLLVLFIPVLDMVLAICRRLLKGQSPMHPDRMHLHHRMLKIGHSVVGAVLILWAWAFVIAFGSILTLFIPFLTVLEIASGVIPVLTFLTLAPHYRQRLTELGIIGDRGSRERKANGPPGSHPSKKDH